MGARLRFSTGTSKKNRENTVVTRLILSSDFIRDVLPDYAATDGRGRLHWPLLLLMHAQMMESADEAARVWMVNRCGERVRSVRIVLDDSWRLAEGRSGHDAHKTYKYRYGSGKDAPQDAGDG